MGRREIVRFRDVGMRYGAGPEVLQGVAFALERGSFHFVTGPSGAGKSSLLKLMSLAHAPSRGRIDLFGSDVSAIPRRERPALRRRIGVVFQDLRLIDRMSAHENVALPLRIGGAGEDEAAPKAAELLRWVGLGALMDARPPTLSGGQAQRVAFARAVISRPDLLLADEPTGNVDDAAAFRLLYLLEELNKDGTTVVIATHDDALISRFDRPLLRLAAGRLTQAPDGEAQ